MNAGCFNSCSTACTVTCVSASSASSNLTTTRHTHRRQNVVTTLVKQLDGNPLNVTEKSVGTAAVTVDIQAMKGGG